MGSMNWSLFKISPMNDEGSRVSGSISFFALLTSLLRWEKNCWKLSVIVWLNLFLTFFESSLIYESILNFLSNWLNTKVTDPLISLKSLKTEELVWASFSIPYPAFPQSFWFITSTIYKFDISSNIYCVRILFTISTSIPAVYSNPGESIRHTTSLSGPKSYSSSSSFGKEVEGTKKNRGNLVVEQFEEPILSYSSIFLEILDGWRVGIPSISVSINS